VSVSDIVEILVGLVSLYLLWQQNQIFKKQNEIFAAQAGGRGRPSNIPKMSVSRRYWPLLLMGALVLVNATITGLDIYSRHHVVVESGPTAGSPKSSVPAEEEPTKFLLTIGPPDVFIPTPKGSQNSRTGVLVRATIWNTGKPSFAPEWSLTVIPRNGMTPVREDSIPINPMGLRVGGTNAAFEISQDEDISIKTKLAKVAETPVEGSVRFFFHLPQSVVENSRIKLTVKDSRGSEFNAEYSPN